MTIQSVRFSAEDVRVLRRLKEIDSLGANGARWLLSAPVLSLLTSSNAVELAVTLKDTDWREIADGIRNLKKVAACTAMQVVLEHLDAGVPKPSGEARKYFEQVLSHTERQCSR